MTKYLRPVNDDQLVETRTTKLVSRVAGDTLDSAGILTRYAGLGALGVCLFVFAFVADVPPNWMAIMASLGTAMAVTGFVGFAVFRIAFKSLLGSHDTVTVTREKDPGQIGEKQPAMVNITPTTITVGPTRWTDEQWVRIAKAVKKKDGKFSRGIIEKSGANIPNLNAEYAKLYPWMLDSRLIVNEAPGGKNPSYRVTTAGRRWLDGYLPSQ